MRRPFNCLSLLTLPALAGFLYWPTGNTGFLGYFGFLVFLRYLWVNPDELFLHTLRRAATAAFLLEVILTGAAIPLFYVLSPAENPIPGALGVSFAAAVFFFCLYHTWLEWKEGCNSV